MYQKICLLNQSKKTRADKKSGNDFACYLRGTEFSGYQTADFSKNNDDGEVFKYDSMGVTPFS